MPKFIVGARLHDYGKGSPDELFGRVAADGFAAVQLAYKKCVPSVRSYADVTDALVAETVTAGTDTAYNIVEDGVERGTIRFEMDGVRHVLLGARGNSNLQASVASGLQSAGENGGGAGFLGVGMRERLRDAGGIGVVGHLPVAQAQRLDHGLQQPHHAAAGRARGLADVLDLAAELADQEHHRHPGSVAAVDGPGAGGHRVRRPGDKQGTGCVQKPPLHVNDHQSVSVHEMTS